MISRYLLITKFIIPKALILIYRDTLYRLSLSNLKLLEYSEWPASLDKRTQCINKGQSEDHCRNYIKILLTNGKFLFTCGTNAFSPQCSYRKVINSFFYSIIMINTRPEIISKL